MDDYGWRSKSVYSMMGIPRESYDGFTQQMDANLTQNYLIIFKIEIVKCKYVCSSSVEVDVTVV